jgi:ribosome-binding factor A
MSTQILEEVSKISSRIRHEVAQKAKKQLRKVPELIFFLDDSLDYIEKIESSLKGLDNPLKK